MAIHHIIFDLGNVLVDIFPEQTLQRFAHHCQEDADTLRRVYLSELHLKLMSGELSPTKFYHEMLKRFHCDLSYDQFTAIWKSLVGGPKPGIDALIQRIPNSIQLSVCSNTDAWHWQVALEKCSFFHRFKYFFLSFELGHLKPDPFCFQYMLQTLRADANQCLFIDDTLENIQTARQFGFHCLHADNADTIQNFLVNHGILPPG